MGAKGSKAKRPSETGASEKPAAEVAATAATKRPSETGNRKPSVAKRPSDVSKIKKRPSETAGSPFAGESGAESTSSTLVRKTSSQAADELHVYARKVSSASDAGKSRMRKGSSQASINNPGRADNQGAGGPKPPDVFYEDVPQQRKTLFDHLVAFYFRNDHDRLLNGDVDIEGICDWALSMPDGIAALNDKLRGKYAEDLDSFLMNAATENEEDDEVAESEEDISEEKELVKQEESKALENEAAMDRPAIPTQRRRPTNTMRFTLNENGEIVAPESAQLDHAAAPDLRSQLQEFITSIDPKRLNEVDNLVKFADTNGLIALNSELLVAFGKDLKGNTLADGQDANPVDVKKFGIGFEDKVLSEMQSHKLHHEDSGKISIDAETGACNKFRLDTESPVFGMCRCGHDRQVHVQKASQIKSSTLERKLAARRASINMEAGGPQPPAQPNANHVTEVPIPQPEEIKPAPRPAPPAPMHPPPAAVAVTVQPKPPRPKSVRRRPISTKQKVQGGDGADGAIERLQAGEKKSEPCSVQEFQLDMSATVFGVCAKCGWKKQDHTKQEAAAQNDSPSSSPAAPADSARPPRPMSLKKDGPPEPCSNYRLDLTADAFGACVCGFARQAHMNQRSNQQKVSSTLEKRWTHMKEIA